MKTASDPLVLRPGTVTVVLTNWRRPKNVLRILDSLPQQSLKPDIFLWNNGDPLSHPAIGMQIHASENLACFPRWWLASIATTEFVCILDDDLIFTDEHVLRDMVHALRDTPFHTIVGLFGMNLVPGKTYRESEQVWPSPDQTLHADLIKGRFMVLRTAALKVVHFFPSPDRHILIGDDIVVSGLLASGQARQHRVPAGFQNRYQELPAEHGLFRQEDHWEHRERARRIAFPF